MQIITIDPIDNKSLMDILRHFKELKSTWNPVTIFNNIEIDRETLISNLFSDYANLAIIYNNDYIFVIDNKFDDLAVIINSMNKLKVFW